MIRILENGKYTTVTCACGCKYAFDFTDIEDGKVACPECGTKNTVTERPENN